MHILHASPESQVGLALPAIWSKDVMFLLLHCYVISVAIRFTHLDLSIITFGHAAVTPCRWLSGCDPHAPLHAMTGLITA